MKIKRSDLVRIVREELARHIESLVTTEPKGHKLQDAHEDKGDEEDKATKKGNEDSPKIKPQSDPDNSAGKTKGKPVATPKGEPKGKDVPPELPAPEEPADKDLEKDAEKPDKKGGKGEEDAADVTGGEIADELTGKTVQSITMEPKSKIMPGAQEIVVTFDQIPDPLRILVGKSGNVKFFFRGMHNKL